jgi:hypothetical protein
VDGIGFAIQISGSSRTPPEGYLFLCPTKDLQIGPHTYRWPACPAYWSLDPSRVARLNTEEADDLGFPAMQLKTEIMGYSWDLSVYAGLRQFHQAKGFNPDTQDLARHLCYPLYQLSEELDVPFIQGSFINSLGVCTHPDVDQSKRTPPEKPKILTVTNRKSPPITSSANQPRRKMVRVPSK